MRLRSGWRSTSATQVICLLLCISLTLGSICKSSPALSITRLESYLEKWGTCESTGEICSMRLAVYFVSVARWSLEASLILPGMHLHSKVHWTLISNRDPLAPLTCNHVQPPAEFPGSMEPPPFARVQNLSARGGTSRASTGECFLCLERL